MWKYEPSTFKLNGVVTNGYAGHGRSRFDSCWTRSSLSIDLGAHQLYRTTEMKIRVLVVWLGVVDETAVGVGSVTNGATMVNYLDESDLCLG